jgi:hypothetical protein
VHGDERDVPAPGSTGADGGGTADDSTAAPAALAAGQLDPAFGDQGVVKDAFGDPDVFRMVRVGE